jgi:AraC-like DNA-binding protein
MTITGWAMSECMGAGPDGGRKSVDPAAVENARFFRPATLPGVEVLQATFLTYRYPPHLHQAWTVAAVNGGAASFDLEGRRHIAPTGTVFVIPPGAVHTGEVASPDGLRYRVLYLDTAPGPASLPDLLATRPPHALPVVMRHERLAADLLRLHGSLDLPGRALEQGEMLACVTSQLTRLVDSSKPRGSRAARAAHPSVDRALTYIQDRWRDDFTLADLAIAAQLSPFHLARLFRQEIGMPPSAYRRALRVCAARRLLQSGLPPAEVAAECGFYDQSHLNRHFKLVTGVTPRQYAQAR